MKFFTKLFSWTLTYKLISLIKNTYYYIRDYNRISDVLYGNDFKAILKKYLNLDIDKDWLGRLYGVLNPNIDINGHFDISNSIVMLDDDNTNNNDQLAQFQAFVFRQLALIGKLFHIDNLYDYITYSLTHVGPLNADNYLLVFDIASRQNMAHSFKQVLTMILIYGIAAFAVYFFII